MRVDALSGSSSAPTPPRPERKATPVRVRESGISRIKVVAKRGPLTPRCVHLYAADGLFIGCAVFVPGQPLRLAKS